MSRYQASVLSLVLLAAVAASPVLAARRQVNRNQQRAAPAKVVQGHWQVAVNRPPAFVRQGDDTSTSSPNLPPAKPGYVWAQVPITETPPPSDAPHSTTEATESGAAAEGSTEPAPVSDPELLKHCQQPRGQFAHPEECEKFYNCWDGYVAVQSCPGGLVFSDQGAFCDFKENVDCSSRGGDPPVQTEAPAQQGEVTTEAPVAGQTEETPAAEGEESEGGEISEEQLKEDIGEGCTKPFSRYRSPKNCDVFVVCSHGTPYRFQCPDTLNYNEELAICDYPYRVDCGNSTSKYPAGEQQSAAEAEQSPEEVWRFFYQQQQFQQQLQNKQRLPADVSAYYGGFAHLPPVRIVSGYNLRG